jgi:hypothetical protein
MGVVGEGVACVVCVIIDGLASLKRDCGRTAIGGGELGLVWDR